eukprot:3156968-Rhodomonas_salina.1
MRAGFGRSHPHTSLPCSFAPLLARSVCARCSPLCTAAPTGRALFGPLPFPHRPLPDDDVTCAGLRAVVLGLLRRGGEQERREVAGEG